MTQRDRYRAGKRLWSAADDRWLRKRYPHESTQKLATELRRTLKAVYARAKNMGLHKTDEYLDSPAACRLRRGDNVGAKFRFQKGHVPANKGLRRPGYAPGRMKETQFKKGQRNGVAAQRYMPVGSTRVIVDSGGKGYLYRKIADTPNVPWTRNWIPEHRRVWEEANGPIPRGHVLAFLNGDRTDIGLWNLECVSRREWMARHTIHTLPPELKNTIQLLGALHRQIHKREKANEKQD